MKKKIAKLISLNSDLSDDLLSYTISLNTFLPVKTETVFGNRSSLKRTYKVTIRFLIFHYTFYVTLDFDVHSYTPCLNRYLKVKAYNVWKPNKKG